MAALHLQKHSGVVFLHWYYCCEQVAAVYAVLEPLRVPSGLQTAPDQFFREKIPHLCQIYEK